MHVSFLAPAHPSVFESEKKSYQACIDNPASVQCCCQIIAVNHRHEPQFFKKNAGQLHEACTSIFVRPLSWHVLFEIGKGNI